MTKLHSSHSGTLPSEKIINIYELASQLEIPDEYHSRQACGITCLWMVLRHIEPTFGLSLQTLHDEQKKNSWHFDPVQMNWLQPGSARYARGLGLKAMAINLTMMGDTPEDIAAIMASERITNGELKDYLSLYELLHTAPDYETRLELAIKHYIGRDIPIMIGVKQGFGSNHSFHRVICAGYDKNDVIIVDPLDDTPSYKRESFGRLAEYSTGNILAVYKDAS